MRSHVSRIFQFVTGKAGATFLLLALVIAVASIPALAQGGVWQVDGQHSIARMSLGSGPRAVEVGVARVSGKVAFESNDPAAPVVSLNITPDSDPGADHSQMSFKSKRSEMTSDGKLAVVGDLSVTRVERSVTLDANEGYYGAEYGEPVVHTDTREVTLVFPGASLSGAQNGAIELTAATHISRERFPQLLTTLAASNWPNLVVEDKNCAMPSTVGEDYSGAVCTGTPVATATNSVAPATAGGGEGYYGFESAVVPDRSQATIAFDLNLTQQTASAPSAASATAEIAGN